MTTTTHPLHPRLEQLLTTITTVTGHAVEFETRHGGTTGEHHLWDVIGNSGERYGVLRVRADESLSDTQRALYAQLSQTIAHEADLRHENVSLANRFRRLDQHNSELTAINRSLSDTAYRDSLTGLYRSWYLHEQVRLELVRACRYRRELSIIVIDADGLSSAGQRLGATVADELVRAVAARITETCRSCDVVARLHGSEFAVVLADTPSAGAAELASRIRRRVESERFPAGGELIALTTITGGVTFVGTPNAEISAESLLETMRQRLNRARRLGLGAIVVS